MNLQDRKPMHTTTATGCGRKHVVLSGMRQSAQRSATLGDGIQLTALSWTQAF